MTIETESLLNLLVSRPPPPHMMLANNMFDQQGLPVPLAAHLAGLAQRIPVQQRTRHASWGSTGSMSSGKSSPMSCSPPLQDLITVQLSSLQLTSNSPNTSPKGPSKLERCLSASSASSQDQMQKNINPSRYKTELCRPFEESGHCKYGEKCQFAHGHQELRNLSRHPKYKTDLCRTYHTVGFCPYGPRCHFIHDEDDYKLTQINHMKQQQMLKQVAQQVAQQQQVLSRIALQQSAESATQRMSLLPMMTASQTVPIPRHQAIDLSLLSLQNAGLSMCSMDSSPASITDSLPSLSPTSMASDYVFGGIPTPPPGFSAIPPMSAPPKGSGSFTFSDVPSPSNSLSGPTCLSSNQHVSAVARSSVSDDMWPVGRAPSVSDDVFQYAAPVTPVESSGEVSPSGGTSPIRLPIFSRLA